MQSSPLEHSTTSTSTPALSRSQVAFLQTLLPKRYSFQLAIVDNKRVRAARKMDESFTADFGEINEKKEIPVDKPQKVVEKIVEKEKERVVEKEKEKEKVSSPLKNTSVALIQQQPVKNDLPRMQAEKMMTSFLLKLKMHRSSWPFRMPVNPVSQAVPNYFQVIREPMDLKSIDRNIKSHSYPSKKEFDRDVRLIIANSYAFNSQDTVYYALTKDFQNYYDQLCVEFRNSPEMFVGGSEKEKVKVKEKEKEKEAEEYQCQEVDIQIEMPVKKKTGAGIGKERGAGKKQAKKENKMPQQEMVAEVPEPKPSMSRLSFKQREQLFHKIQNLSQTNIKNLLRCLNGPNSLLGNWQQIQIDLSELSPQKFQLLQLFLKEIPKQ